MRRVFLFIVGLLGRIGESYHDVSIFINDREFHIAGGGYGLELTCCRAAGWRLWNTWQTRETPELIGGEYDSEKFVIKINGCIICDNRRR